MATTTCIRYWTNKEPQRAKLMHLSTFRHAEQMIDDLIRLGWRAEIAPPHISEMALGGVRAPRPPL